MNTLNNVKKNWIPCLRINPGTTSPNNKACPCFDLVTWPLNSKWTLEETTKRIETLWSGKNPEIINSGQNLLIIFCILYVPEPICLVYLHYIYIDFLDSKLKFLTTHPKKILWNRSYFHYHHYILIILYVSFSLTKKGRVRFLFVLLVWIMNELMNECNVKLLTK